MNIEELTAKLLDRDKWPSYPNPDYLNKLSELANDDFSADDTKGCVASILIHQQLSEAMIKVLLESCYFLIQVKVMPLKIELTIKNKSMFGQIIRNIENTIDFPQKDEVVKKANSINQHRIEVAHGLVKVSGLKDYSQKAKQVRSEFEMLFADCTNSMDWIRTHLANCRNDYVTKDADKNAP